MGKYVANYDYDQAVLVESLAQNLGLPMDDREVTVLRKNTLALAKRVRYETSERDAVYREIRIAQINGNEAEELKLFRKLNKMEKVDG